MRRPRRAPGAAVALAAVLATAPAAGAPAPVPVQRTVVGHSVQGRPIVLDRVGDAAAPRRILVVGCVHGNECAARTVVAALRDRVPPAGSQLLLVPTGNPDGEHAGRRGNAHGVDLNRNSSAGWRPLRGGYYSGPRPWSEPESRALRALVLRERPVATVWYHQPFGLVDRPEQGADLAARAFARRAGLPFGPLGPRPGSLSRWVNTRVRPGSSFVVELRAGPLSAAAVQRHVRAILLLGAGR